MKKQKSKVLYTKILATKILMIIGIVIILGLVLYCMVNHLGLIDSLDFGAGAYYYADIPEFTKYVNGDAYQSETPMWMLIALFLGWGGVMYGLWSWLDKKAIMEKQKKSAQAVKQKKEADYGGED